MIKFLICIFVACYLPEVYAIVEAPVAPMVRANAYLDAMVNENHHYVLKQGEQFFKDKNMGQTPVATMVSCSDSRVHTNVVDASPEGNLFIIKNIGNQLSTALGSVKYGVNHLHTPLLIIVGHSNCGAITAASSDYSKLEPSIVQELNSLHLPIGLTNIEGVKLNVHNQVAFALSKFKSLVDKGELLVVGAIYDFSNDLKKGAGEFTVINIQGKVI